MNRKEFLKKSCGACAAMGVSMIFGSSFLTACATAGISVLKTKNIDNKILIPLSKFEDGKAQLLRVQDYDFDLVAQKKEDGTFIVMIMMCTHAMHPLTKAGNNFYCTLHGSKFDEEGQVTKGPAAEPLERLKYEIIEENLVIYT